MSTFFIISLSLNVIFFFHSAFLFPFRVSLCSRYPCLSSSLLVALMFLSTVVLALSLPSLTFLFHFVAVHVCIVAILFLETICIYNSFLLFLGLFKHSAQTIIYQHGLILFGIIHVIPVRNHLYNILPIKSPTKQTKHSWSKSYAASVTNVSHCGRCD